MGRGGQVTTIDIIIILTQLWITPTRLRVAYDLLIAYWWLASASECEDKVRSTHRVPLCFTPRTKVASLPLHELARREVLHYHLPLHDGRDN